MFVQAAAGDLAAVLAVSRQVAVQRVRVALVAERWRSGRNQRPGHWPWLHHHWRNIGPLRRGGDKTGGAMPTHVGVSKKRKKGGESINVSANGHLSRDFKIFVGGIPCTSGAEEVRALFAQCGEMESFHMPFRSVAKQKGQSKGYAIINYTSKKALEKGLKLNGIEFGGGVLAVKIKREKDAPTDAGKDSLEKENEFEVFVGGLFGMSEKCVRERFATCGEIQSFVMPLTPRGQFKGIAFIGFNDQSSMDNALKLHNKTFRKKTLTVEKKVAKSVRHATDAAPPAAKSRHGAPLARLNGNIIAPSGTKVVLDESSDEE